MGKTESASDNRPLREVVAVNVRRARERKNMSVDALARGVGRPREYIEAVEAAQLPELDALEMESLAAALDVEDSDLVKRGAAQ